MARDCRITCSDGAEDELAEGVSRRRGSGGDSHVSKGCRRVTGGKSRVLPDVNIFGSYFNQTFLPIIQPNFGAIGVAASCTIVNWGKQRHVEHQREFEIAQAQKNTQATSDKVVLEARQAYAGFEQADEALRLANQKIQARRDVERSAEEPTAIQTAKVATAKAELEQLHPDANDCVAHAKLMEVIGAP